MTSLQPLPYKPPVFTWRLGLLLLILVSVSVWVILTFNVFGISRWLDTHPQYNGKVTLTELSIADANVINAVLDKWKQKDFDSIPMEISAELKNKPELLRHPYFANGDTLGNIYVMVDVQHYEMFTPEVCKVYKVEGNNLSLVRNLPNDLWCNSLTMMFTDYRGNWFVFGMTHDGGETLDVYKIEGTSGLYVSELQPMQEFFYNENDGSLYAGVAGANTGNGGHYWSYYKVTFAP